MIAIETARERTEKMKRLRLRVGNLSDYTSIYKYVSLNGRKSWKLFEKMCSQCQLIGATLNSLNDPLEGGARIFDDLTDQKIAESCVYFSKSETEANAQSDPNFCGFDEVPRLVEEKFQSTLESARILSFCNRADSHLLWSHYANAHRGACIHFNVSGFSHPDLIIGRVAYSDHRPVLPKSLMARLAVVDARRHHPEDRLLLRKELYETLFFTKPIDWSYEQEVRIIYLSTDMTNVPFNPASLFEIIVGARADRETEERIRELAEQSIPETRVRRAVINEDTFGVGLK